MNPARFYLQAIPSRSTLLRTLRRYHAAAPLQFRLKPSPESLPRVAQPSLWTSMVPKFWRTRGSRDVKDDSQKPKEWNPASFFIVIFVLIGSQAIRMIALKNDFAAYTRSTDAKITLLREVIERVKRGEKVDVEKLLGTGDEAKEREWDEVLREIEEEDSLWHKKATEAEKAQRSKAEPVEGSATKGSVPHHTEKSKDESSQHGRPSRRPSFL